MREVTDVQRRARLAARHAIATRVGSVAQAVEQMTCLHATEPASVYLSTFARVDASRADIDRALYEDRAVVKQLAMRRTLFVFPRDLLPAVWGSASDRVAGQLKIRLAKEVESHELIRDPAPPPSCASRSRPSPSGWKWLRARPTAAASRSHPDC